MKADPYRLNKERDFHDSWASDIQADDIDIDVFFKGATAPENRFILSRIGDVKGKYLLELGCGAGENSVFFARMGAHCVASDLSPGMLTIARQLAQKYKVQIEIRVLNAMQIEFPANTFDIVYAANILHHVDTSQALAEIHRVLKPGGLVCVWDPLIHNPLIKIYRKIATDVRTLDEHPLHINIVKKIKRIFSDVEYETFWFATLWLFLRFFFVERVNPNKERYWKKIIYEEGRLRSVYFRLEKIDRLIKKIPLLERYGWNIAIVAKK